MDEQQAQRPESVVRKAAEEDLAAVTMLLTRAFDEDPVANWMVRQDRHRRRRIHRLMDLGCRRMAYARGVVSTTDGYEGALLWFPRDTWKMGNLQQLQLIPEFLRIAGVRRIKTVLSGIQKVEKHHPTARHVYLLALGVDTAHQGRGVGSRLLQSALDVCDGEGLPAYLESTNERNNPLYERFGFVTQREVQLPGEGPKVWLMWRDARR